jgi:hypothetical protein
VARQIYGGGRVEALFVRGRGTKKEKMNDNETKNGKGKSKENLSLFP